ncbi:carboxylesterase/lipase family protein [Nocardia sp. NBC_00403]|uniref:carboxylesterase/lipase family protein n=1 Tax=Nocardia sp. NBC_00403 TaxID=2975990 RepID=UPI002E22DBDC
MTDMLHTVETRYGPVRGQTRGRVHAFLGIPYATAPVGKHRFLPPSPPPPWREPRDATRPGPTAARAPYVPAYHGLVPELSIPGDELLNLSIWTPATDGALPVLVWIHGGAFTNGSNALPTYDSTAFATGGVVVVAVNYRLGGEGWLHFGGETVNLGILDVVTALEWVRENIAAFGGDPARVTIAGQSAGAMLATTLTAVPRARGLFHGLIAHSGAGANTISPDEAHLLIDNLAARIGVEPTLVAFEKLSIDELSVHVRDVLNEVQTAADPTKWGRLALTILPFAPVVDGSIVTTEPLVAIAAGAASDVAILSGSNAEDARLILVSSGAIDQIDEAALAAAGTAYGLDVGAALPEYRRSRPEASPGDLLCAVVTDWFFRIPAIRLAEAQAAAGGPAWAFRFDWRSPRLGGRLGAAHAVDLPFVFKTHTIAESHTLVGAHAPDRVADNLHGAYRAFAAEADPGWAPYDPLRRTTGLIAETVTIVEDPDATERLLWDGVR